MRCRACNGLITGKLFERDSDQRLIMVTTCNKCDKETNIALAATTKVRPDPVGDALKVIWAYGSISTEELPV